MIVLRRYVERPQELKGYGCVVKFEEIQTLESVITRKQTIKYMFFAKVVTSHKPLALIQSWPDMIILFDSKEKAQKCCDELKKSLETANVLEGELVFNSQKTDASTQNKEKSDA